jgi:hypothetical protein
VRFVPDLSEEGVEALELAADRLLGLGADLAEGSVAGKETPAFYIGARKAETIRPAHPPSSLRTTRATRLIPPKPTKATRPTLFVAPRSAAAT